MPDSRTHVLAHPARRLRDAAEPIAMHAVGSPATRDALARLGLDRFEGYVWARAAGLGEPVPGVVVAVFGVFEPAWLTAAYRRARAACDRAALLDTRATATVRSLHATLPEADVTGAVRVLRRGLHAASAEGRPLFAGLADQPWPEDPLGQLWRACELLREHRGDTHLRVCLNEDLQPVEMNLLTELWHGIPLGRYTRTRGWSEQTVAARAAAPGRARPAAGGPPARGGAGAAGRDREPDQARRAGARRRDGARAAGCRGGAGRLVRPLRGRRHLHG